MTVKKPVPCSLLDIRGIQEWLDEMALQGLFLVDVNRKFDRAEFELGDPAPVRYRLDPVGKDVEKDKDREGPYAEMGWKFVCHIPRWYYIFSCGDPEAPELYSDPQSLAIAMEPMIRRDLRSSILGALFCVAVFFLCFLVRPGSALRNMLLWEYPQDLVLTVLYPILLVLCLPLFVFDFRRIVKIRDTLAQGLTLKAKKRRKRIPFLAWYIPLYLSIFLLPRLLLPETNMEYFDLSEAPLSRPWPGIVQTEAAGPRPLGPSPEPYAHGYAATNSSWFVPIQEYASTDWDTRSSGSFWTGVRYFKARSPRVAELIWQMERDKEARYHENALTYPGNSRITELQPFQPWDWPGLDRAELARYHRQGHDIWTLLLQRGNDVVMVEYSGYARPEDCIGLFLEALDKEGTP